MKILIVAATDFEVKLLINAAVKSDLDILISGIGGVPTSYSLLKKVYQEKYDFMIQAGIAGSFDHDVKLGEVVAVSHDFFGDLGVVENNSRKSLFDMNLMGYNEWPFTNGLLENTHKTLLNNTGLTMVKAVSVNEITTGADDIEYYKNRGIAVESMEGAAFHYVALMEQIPFLQVRSISNYVGERDKTQWKLDDAIQQLNDFLIDYIPKVNL